MLHGLSFASLISVLASVLLAPISSIEVVNWPYCAGLLGFWGWQWSAPVARWMCGIGRGIMSTLSVVWGIIKCFIQLWTTMFIALKYLTVTFLGFPMWGQTLTLLALGVLIFACVSIVRRDWRYATYWQDGHWYSSNNYSTMKYSRQGRRKRKVYA